MKELSDDELNIAICEWLGWTEIQISPNAGMSGKSLFTAGSCLHGVMPRDKNKCEDDQRFVPIPSHITGLEALGNMQVALGLLNEGLRGQYMEKLYKLSDACIEPSYVGEHDFEGMFGLLIIPAKLQAIALLRVVKPELFV